MKCEGNLALRNTALSASFVWGFGGRLCGPHFTESARNLQTPDLLKPEAVLLHSETMNGCVGVCEILRAQTRPHNTNSQKRAPVMILCSTAPWGMWKYLHTAQLAKESPDQLCVGLIRKVFMQGNQHAQAWPLRGRNARKRPNGRLRRPHTAQYCTETPNEPSDRIAPHAVL